MRIVLVTDSLGIPRPETPVEDTWVDRIIQKYSDKDCFFYTYSSPGLSSKNIPVDYIDALHPDLLIVQVGVVDACRRTMRPRVSRVISIIPGLSKLVWNIRKNRHYQITKCVNIHYASLDEFRSVFQRIKNTSAKRIWAVPIAPASEIMMNNTYNFYDDVMNYNKIIKDLEDGERFFYLDIWGEKEMYNRENPPSMFLDDGHHLDKSGLSMVFAFIDNKLTELKSEWV